MVLLQSFDNFAEEADKLYMSAPAYTRYTSKYRHCDGKLVLKVTNDIIVSAPARSRRARPAPSASRRADARAPTAPALYRCRRRSPT